MAAPLPAVGPQTLAFHDTMTTTLLRQLLTRSEYVRVRVLLPFVLREQAHNNNLNQSSQWFAGLCSSVVVAACHCPQKY